MSDTQAVIEGYILSERTRQDSKWGQQNHDDLYWLSILTEEVGEAAKAINDHTHDNLDTFHGISHIGFNDVHAEVVQCAAVCVAWLEEMERRTVRRQ